MCFTQVSYCFKTFNQRLSSREIVFSILLQPEFEQRNAFLFRGNEPVRIIDADSRGPRHWAAGKIRKLKLMAEQHVALRSIK